MSKENEQSNPFLLAWNSRVNQYGQFFQVHGASARDDVKKLQSSPLTNWKDVTQRQGRHHLIDSIDLRRQLGEITPEEVSEVNRVLGGNPVTGYQFTRSSSEPALLKAWNKLELLAFLGAGGAFGAYGRVVRGYNNLWLAAAIIPVMTWSVTMGARQPTTLIDNAYR